eukprot:Amastigsp_a31_524.p2 type:complete len:217 gc:universal Amastigsp_a31_524:676-26(-)
MGTQLVMSASDSDSDSGAGGAALEHVAAPSAPLVLPHFYELLSAWVWLALDVNKDHVIDTHEWVTGVAKLVPDSDPAKVKADLKKFDADDNGKLDFHEYCQWMQAWDVSGQTVIREAEVQRLVALAARFAGTPAVVNWDGFLECARTFIPRDRETVPLDEAFGRQLLASVGLDTGLVSGLTFGEAIICLTALWHGPPQAQTVAFYYRNMCAHDGRK